MTVDHRATCANATSRNLAANAAALGVDLILPDAKWTTARDGALTAIIDSQWLAGCSVPRRSAERMVERTTVRGNVACLLLPMHAQQVDACLRRLGRACAIIAILPDADALPMMLACVDFSAAIAGRQLYFAYDQSSLNDIFHHNPGLPLPQQFIKLPTIDSIASDGVIAWAQQVFSQQSAAHSGRIAAAMQAAGRGNQICIAAGRTFKLWDDAGDALARAVGGEAIDTDQPAESAVAWIAERAASAAALITVDTCRADSPLMVAADKPWITWATHRRVPAFVTASPWDGLIVVDDSLIAPALAAGWPRDRVVVAGWPVADGVDCPPPMNAPCALIANIGDLQPTAEIDDFSSWRLVWDACRAELLARPQAIGDDPAAYLHRVRVRHDVAEDNFPEAVMLERLIEPASIVGTARWLHRAGVPLSLHGSGWDAFEDLADRISGPIHDRHALADATRNACALIDPFVIRPGHPVGTCGRPIVRTVGRTTVSILQNITAARAGRLKFSTDRAAISDAVIRRLLV